MFTKHFLNNLFKEHIIEKKNNNNNKKLSA